LGRRGEGPCGTAEGVWGKWVISGRVSRGGARRGKAREVGADTGYHAGVGLAGGRLVRESVMRRGGWEGGGGWGASAAWPHDGVRSLGLWYREGTGRQVAGQRRDLWY